KNRSGTRPTGSRRTSTAAGAAPTRCTGRPARTMARQPRTRRRRDNYQAPAERSRQRRREIKPVGQPKSQTGQRRERRGGFRGFVAESIAELKKVEWAGKHPLFSAEGGRSIAGARV